jgi:hypothetical protein
VRRRLKPRHVNSDLRHDCCGGNVSDTGDLDHALGADAKRVEAFAHLAIELVDGRLQPICLSDRDFGQRGIDAALNVKTTAMTRSEQITD